MNAYRDTAAKELRKLATRIATTPGWVWDNAGQYGEERLGYAIGEMRELMTALHRAALLGRSGAGTEQPTKLDEL